MTLTSLLNIPCTLLRESKSTDHASGGDVGEDTYGNPIPADANDSASDDNYELPTMCWVQQDRRTEPPAAGEMSDTLWTVFLPYGTVVDTSDSVEVAGYGTFEFVGDPWAAKQGSPHMWHVEATARRTGPGPEGS